MSMSVPIFKMPTRINPFNILKMHLKLNVYEPQNFHWVPHIILLHPEIKTIYIQRTARTHANQHESKLTSFYNVVLSQENAFWPFAWKKNRIVFGDRMKIFILKFQSSFECVNIRTGFSLSLSGSSHIRTVRSYFCDLETNALIIFLYRSTDRFGFFESKKYRLSNYRQT